MSFPLLSLPPELVTHTLHLALYTSPHHTLPLPLSCTPSLHVARASPPLDGLTAEIFVLNISSLLAAAASCSYLHTLLHSPSADADIWAPSTPQEADILASFLAAVLLVDPMATPLPLSSPLRALLGPSLAQPELRLPPQLHPHVRHVASSMWKKWFSSSKPSTTSSQATTTTSSQATTTSSQATPYSSASRKTHPFASFRWSILSLAISFTKGLNIIDPATGGDPLWVHGFEPVIANSLPSHARILSTAVAWDMVWLLLEDGHAVVIELATGKRIGFWDFRSVAMEIPFGDLDPVAESELLIVLFQSIGLDIDTAWGQDVGQNSVFLPPPPPTPHQIVLQRTFPPALVDSQPLFSTPPGTRFDPDNPSVPLGPNPDYHPSHAKVMGMGTGLLVSPVTPFPDTRTTPFAFLPVSSKASFSWVLKAKTLPWVWYMVDVDYDSAGRPTSLTSSRVYLDPIREVLTDRDIISSYTFSDGRAVLIAINPRGLTLFGFRISDLMATPGAPPGDPGHPQTPRPPPTFFVHEIPGFSLDTTLDLVRVQWPPPPPFPNAYRPYPPGHLSASGYPLPFLNVGRPLPGNAHLPVPSFDSGILVIQGCAKVTLFGITSEWDTLLPVLTIQIPEFARSSFRFFHEISGTPRDDGRMDIVLVGSNCIEGFLMSRETCPSDFVLSLTTPVLAGIPFGVSSQSTPPYHLPESAWTLGGSAFLLLRNKLLSLPLDGEDLASHPVLSTFVSKSELGRMYGDIDYPVQDLPYHRLLESPYVAARLRCSLSSHQRVYDNQVYAHPALIPIPVIVRTRSGPGWMLATGSHATSVRNNRAGDTLFLWIYHAPIDMDTRRKTMAPLSASQRRTLLLTKPWREVDGVSPSDFPAWFLRLPTYVVMALQPLAANVFHAPFLSPNTRFAMYIYTLLFGFWGPVGSVMAARAFPHSGGGMALFSLALSMSAVVAWSVRAKRVFQFAFLATTLFTCVCTSLWMQANGCTLPELSSILVMGGVSQGLAERVSLSKASTGFIFETPLGITSVFSFLHWVTAWFVTIHLVVPPPTHSPWNPELAGMAFTLGCTLLFLAHVMVYKIKYAVSTTYVPLEPRPRGPFKFLVHPWQLLVGQMALLLILAYIYMEAAWTVLTGSSLLMWEPEIRDVLLALRDGHLRYVFSPAFLGKAYRLLLASLPGTRYASYNHDWGATINTTLASKVVVTPNLRPVCHWNGTAADPMDFTLLHPPTPPHFLSVIWSYIYSLCILWLPYDHDDVHLERARHFYSSIRWFFNTHVFSYFLPLVSFLEPYV